METHSTGGEDSDISSERISSASAQDSPPISPTWPTISDVHRALRPLQATADRVGKQVEEFAETLDRLSKNRCQEPKPDCTHALALVNGYRQIARTTVTYLRGLYAPEPQKGVVKRWSDKPRKTPSIAEFSPRQVEHHVTATTIEDLERWEQEEQTWHLLGLMLQVEYPPADVQRNGAIKSERLIRPSKAMDIHQYSSEHDLWSDFLAHDDQAWERNTVVEWLKRCADESSQDIEQVIQNLEESADRGSGLWAHSWLYTKEALKGEKRLRSWPQTLAPDSPGIEYSLRNLDQAMSLVTQLDPDASTRQDRGLQPQDMNFERATWLACWTMLRRGRDWRFVRSWCQERVENWRAIAIRGDPRQHALNDTKPLRQTERKDGWQSRALWRKTCALAARRGGMDQYEAAVYGAVSGYLPAMQKVCGNWNDYLFAHYNSYLLRSFDQHVAITFSDRLPHGLKDHEGPFDFSMSGGIRTLSGNQLIEKMRYLKSLDNEAKDPIKQLQGSLIGKTFDSFVQKYGFQLLQARNRQTKELKALTNAEQTHVKNTKKPLVQTDDYQLIRMITHIILIYQDLKNSRLDKARSKAAEIFVEAYTDFLGKAGKQQLLPLYASRLSSDSAIRALSQQLPRILEFGERRTVVRLMQQHGIDVPSVLGEQLWMIMKNIEAKADYDTRDPKYPSLRILESRSDEQRVAVREIQGGFMGDRVTDDQHDLINGFEWYLLLDGHWNKTLANGGVLYKHFLRLPCAKGLAAARELAQRVSFSTLSRNKTNAILGCEIDLGEIYDEEEHSSVDIRGTINSDARFSRHGSGNARSYSQPEKARYLLQQSNSFQNFEQLIHLLSAFEQWQTAIKQKPRTSELGGNRGKQWRDQLKKACELIETRIQPLLHGWLQSPRNDSEATELEEIRRACVPEVVLTYIVILNSSAQFVSRELLLKSLEVGAMVASRRSDLESCFVSAGRMPELMETLAFTSTTMLLANEQRASKKRTSARLGIWSTTQSLNATA